MVVDFGHFQTANTAMKKTLELAKTVALTPAPVLICGESGTGKNLLVTMIAEKARQSVSLKWTPSRKPGLADFKNAEICLIEDLHRFSAFQQAELNETIDVLKEQGIRVRWIALTNEDLAIQVQNNNFRRDLFFRLSVIQLKVPSLNERPEDIEVLAGVLTDMFCVLKNEPKKTLSPDALAKLKAHTWHSNVTELENVLERAVAITAESVIPATAIELFAETAAEPVFSGGTTLSEMERKLILQTLQMTQQNKTRAAQILGISIRTLRNKLNEYREAGTL